MNKKTEYQDGMCLESPELPQQMEVVLASLESVRQKEK